MQIDLRPARPEDAERCGEICYEAFRVIAAEHNFRPDFPDKAYAVKTLARMIAAPTFYAVVAEVAGKVVGSNFIDERGAIVGLGPITVDPGAQNGGAGGLLMQHMLDRCEERGVRGVRLTQSAYHSRSLCLYAKLGFGAREPLSVMGGDAIEESIVGHEVRLATEDDVEACNALCMRVHGIDRDGELRDAVQWGKPLVVEHEGRIAGYATTLGSAGHAVAETTDALKALIGSGRPIRSGGMFVPTRNAELFRWCLEKGLRMESPGTLMSLGDYQEPQGAFLPSSLY